MSVIRGFTQMMAHKLNDHTYSQIALKNIDEVIELAEKARQLDRIVGTDLTREETNITALIEEIVETVTEEYSCASFSVEYEEAVTAAVLPTFERALRELIENAAKHTGENPTVTISVELVPNGVEIQIDDDGPGLAAHEVDVLQSGSETPLTHGSGLGLWLTHWIVTSHDGSIDASVTEDGTTMAITIPRKSVSAIHHQQTKLQRARDQYQAAFHEANDAMVFINNQAKIIDANPEASDIYGLERQALLGQPIQRFLEDEFDFENAWREFNNVSEERDTVTIVGADDVKRQVEYTATTNVVPGQHLVVSRDVTERVEREAELQRKTRAMDEAPVGITLSDPDQEDNPVVYANEQFYDLTKYGPDETLGQNCRYLQGNGTDPAKVARIREAIDAEEPITEILRNYRKDGTSFWSRLTIAPITDGTGDLTNYVGFQEDVTERIERERAIKETKQRLQAIVEASPDAIIAVDENGTIDVWNDAAEAMFGYDAETVVGNSIRSLELHANDQRAEFERNFERALAGDELVNHEIFRQTKSGDSIRLSLSTAPITDESGNINGVVGIAKHLTEDSESSAAK